MPSARSKAFSVPLPDGWIPAIGEEVYVSPPYYIFSCGKVLSVVPSLGGANIYVRVQAFNGHKTERNFMLGQLRPVDQPKP